MPHRFFLPGLPESGAALLEGLEAHHLIHVLRARMGDVVELFDGAGLVALAEVIKLTKRDVSLQIQQTSRRMAAPKRVVLATAVPKGDRFDWLIEKATELAVSLVIPLTTTRSVVDPRDSKLEKLRQTVISACKQSGRNFLMDLAPVTAWKDFVETRLSGGAAWIAHPGGESLPTGSALWAGHDSAVFAVGPEGGLTDDEVRLAEQHGAKRVSLGANILRIETAAIALAAIAQATD